MATKVKHITSRDGEELEVHTAQYAEECLKYSDKFDSNGRLKDDYAPIGLSTSDIFSRLRSGVLSDVQSDIAKITPKQGTGISSITSSYDTKGNTVLNISLSDGTSTPITINKGNGISNISKTDSDGLNDTYTIDMSDGTSTTFNVTNGKGISKIDEKTDGLSKTYTFNYNDGTSTSLDVSDGKDSHLWKAYSAIEAPHTDYKKCSADNAIYLGISTANEEPTSESEYDWTKIKGDKGDNGKDSHFTAAYSKTETHEDWNSCKPDEAIYLGTSTKEEPSNADDFTWSEIKGSDGANAYLWRVYSKTSDHSDFESCTADGAIYLGLSGDETKPTTADGYEWTKIKGDKGSTGNEGKNAFDYYCEYCNNNDISPVKEDEFGQLLYELLNSEELPDAINLLLSYTTSSNITLKVGIVYTFIDDKEKATFQSGITNNKLEDCFMGMSTQNGKCTNNISSFSNRFYYPLITAQSTNDTEFEAVCPLSLTTSSNYTLVFKTTSGSFVSCPLVAVTKF